MSLYARLVNEAQGTRATPEAQDLARTLAQWHDEMVLHQRHVKRAGAREACSPECPHAVAVELWKEACRLLGAAAGRLEFLRQCADRSNTTSERVAGGTRARLGRVEGRA